MRHCSIVNAIIIQEINLASKVRLYHALWESPASWEKISTNSSMRDLKNKNVPEKKQPD